MSTEEDLDWKRKLPNNFQTQLENISKTVVREQPANIYDSIATYLEGKVLSRISKSYVEKNSH